NYFSNDRFLLIWFTDCWRFLDKISMLSTNQ
ncbi:TonB-dependent receptor, partial [Salmonella enterica]|nr:TonB-dependent receptor [Salmonella enterica]